MEEKFMKVQFEEFRLLGGVRLGMDTVFVPGMEDQLREAATDEQLAHLARKGVLVNIDGSRIAEPETRERSFVPTGDQALHRKYNAVDPPELERPEFGPHDPNLARIFDAKPVVRKIK
jgi:hypothetical protein